MDRICRDVMFSQGTGFGRSLRPACCCFLTVRQPVADFRHYYELEDNLFTLKLTPNRGDCLGLSGYGTGSGRDYFRRSQSVNINSLQVSPNEALAIQVDAPEACPLYCGRVIRDVSLDVPTPQWILRRLERSGMRAINPVVDVTNYVMLETGQPLHAFDLAKISNASAGAVHVRYARPGEKLQLLNGENLVLDPGMLLIADEAKPLALAGIMGGNESGVGQGQPIYFWKVLFSALR